jgi:predicted trehalose synthase
VRAQLVESITRGAPAGSGLTRIDMPAPVLDEPVEIKTAFEPYRRFVAAHQRQMESTLRSLRAQLRLQLSKRASAGQQLAALDSAFENILAEREAALLAKTSKLLEKRFVQALKAHMQAQTQPANLITETTDAIVDATDVSDPNPNHTPKSDTSSWLMPLRQTIRQALLAELDTRLQPALGLLEALTSFATQEQ